MSGGPGVVDRPAGEVSGRNQLSSSAKHAVRGLLLAARVPLGDAAMLPSLSHQHHAYRTRGQYAEQLERLDRIFGRERICVVDSHAFFTDPEPVYDTVLEFLGLPHRGYPLFKPHNSRARAPMPPAVRAALSQHYRPHDERLAAWLGREPSWRRTPHDGDG